MSPVSAIDTIWFWIKVFLHHSVMNIPWVKDFVINIYHWHGYPGRNIIVFQMHLLHSITYHYIIWQQYTSCAGISGEQCLDVMILDVKQWTRDVMRDSLPLSPKSTLCWAGWVYLVPNGGKLFVVCAFFVCLSGKYEICLVSPGIP